MKALTTLSLFLLTATGILAQINPDNMFIDGYVLDTNGQAVANHQVCVAYVSNSPALPSDTACASTNANGYYFIEVQNGSVTGPNVNFEVSTEDPCAFVPLTEVVSNGQGTVDTATVNFTICAVGGCSVSIQLDSSQFGPVLVAMGTGAPPFTYVWNTGETTAQIGGLTPDSTYCVTISDSTGCISTECFYYGSPISCDGSFTTTGPDSLGGYTFTADVQNIGWNYLWTADNIIVSSVSVFQTTFSTGTHEICLTVTDSVNNCTATQCETIFVGGCNASFTTVGPTPTGGFTFTADIQNVGWDYLWTADNLIISSVSTAQTTLSNGIHEVCLTVTDTVSNCTNTQCQTIMVGGCDASFTTLGPDSLGEYTFSPDVQNIGWNYTWTANNTVVSSVSVFQSSLTNGVNEVCLIVSDPINNCSDTVCQTITVGNNCFGYLTGEVYAGTNNQPLDAGVVYLITLDLQTNQLVAVDSMVLDTSNYYYFGPLACGDYLVKAASYASSQYYSNYIPTYYGNSPFWGFAQTISLSQTNPQVDADITLIAANNPGGPGFIGGDVTQGANKTDPGDPLSGMQVMLFNLNGAAIAYTYTDQNGEFGFDNLAWGTYQVYVEVLGVQTIPAIVTIGPEQPSVDDVHIFVTDELITTGIEEFDFEGAISEVYPNPVFGDGFIRFNLPNAVVADLNVLDLSGRLVSTSTVSISNGESLITIDSEGLNGGYYLLNIQDVEGNFSVTRRFLRVD